MFGGCGCDRHATAGYIATSYIRAIRCMYSPVSFQVLQLYISPCNTRPLYPRTVHSICRYCDRSRVRHALCKHCPDALSRVCALIKATILRFIGLYGGPIQAAFNWQWQILYRYKNEQRQYCACQAYSGTMIARMTSIHRVCRAVSMDACTVNIFCISGLSGQVCI